MNQSEYQAKYQQVLNHVLEYKEYINNKVIFDVGSNIGLFTLAVAKNCEYKEIHTFEPANEYYNESKKILSNFKEIKMNNIGLGSTNEDLILYKAGHTHIGWNTFYTKDPNQNNNFTDKMIKEVCTVNKLDDYVKENNINDIGFIKIDVEGFETHVLEGGFETLNKFKPVLFIEVGWGTKHPDWVNCLNVYNKLFDMGYKKIEFSDETEDILFVLDELI